MAARWVPADTFLRAMENQQEPTRSLGYLVLDSTGRPVPPPTPPAPATLDPGPWLDLLPRIDEVVAEIRKQHKRKLAGYIRADGQPAGTFSIHGEARPA